MHKSLFLGIIFFVQFIFLVPKTLAIVEEPYYQPIFLITKAETPSGFSDFDIREILSPIINTVYVFMSFLCVAAISMILYNYFRFRTYSGSEDTLSDIRWTVIRSTIMIILFIGMAIVKHLLN